MDTQAKETIELLDAVFGLADASQKSLADDGKITLTDAGNFFGPSLKLPAAIGGIQKVPRELAELDDESRQYVLDYYKKRFDLPDDKLEVLIERALQAGYDFAMSIVALVKYRKAA